MNTPSLEDNGFSAKLRGNPHASRPNAGPGPLDKLQHVAGRVDVAVGDETEAVAAVHPVRDRLRPVGITPASAASPGGAARGDEEHRTTGAFGLEAQHVPQLRPRGVANRPGKKRALQRLHVQILHRDHAMSGGQAVKEPLQDLPLGVAAVSGQFRDRVPDGSQLASLGVMAEADALPVPGFGALPEVSVAEVAEVSGHVREGRFLRPVRARPALAAPDLPPAHVHHAFFPCRAGRHRKGCAFPCESSMESRRVHDRQRKR